MHSPKLDFKQEDDVIKTQFGSWLSLRRHELLKKYDLVTTRENPRWKVNRNEVFRPKILSVPGGKAHKKRQCEDYLKALGGLRAFRHCGGDDWEAEKMTRSDKGRGLYTDMRSWKRAETQAGGVMLRLSRAWMQVGLPYDVFRSEANMAPLDPNRWMKKLPTSNVISRKETDFIRKFLDNNFSLEALAASES